MNQILAGIIVAPIFATAVLAQTQGQTAATSAASSESLAEVKRAIDKGNAQWIEGFEKSDPALVTSIFAEDGVILAGNGKVFKGHQQIIERQKALMQLVGQEVKVTVTTVKVWLDGDTAYETGKYAYRYQDKGKPVTEEGRYVTMWKRQKDGSWILAMDMGVPQE